MTYLLQSMLILIAAAVTSTPPNGRPIALHVELSGCAVAPEEIDVVLDGDEGSRRPLVRGKGADVWVGEWTDHRKRKFPSAPLSASVRLKNGRTYCRLATAAKDENDRLVAKFLFHCDYAPVREVTVGTISPTSFDYERRLPKASRKGDGLDCDCAEGGAAVSGSQNVSQLLFPHENFSIHFLDDAETARSSDLLILDPKGEDPAAAVPAIFDPLVRKYAVKAGADPRCKQDALCLERQGVINALGEQRARARRRLSGQEYSLDEKSLQRLNLLTLMVK